MEEKKKEYKGFWKDIGCILSVVAILGIITIIILGIYMLLQGL
ncbi:hypothetical protein [uncultured Allomuricauda sp.]|nr:hypothetical protein [uncultured Allomuricauda sp.]